MAQCFREAKPPDDVGMAKPLTIDLQKLFGLETNPEKQATLRRLLIEEADKLAKNPELESSTRRVREGAERLERLRRTKPARNDRDDHSLLRLMELTQKLLENFHRRLMEEYPYSVKLHDAIVGVCSTLDEAKRCATQFTPEAVVSVVDASQGRGEIFHPKS